MHRYGLGIGPPETEERTMANQTRLPGMTPKRIAALEDAAEEYVNIRDERMEKNKEENAANEKLVKLMKKHNLKTYPIEASEESPARVITLELRDPTERAKVRASKTSKKNGENEE